ncbi:MAG: 30S ribosomal protein S20 [Planctomycetia bacterium]|jgi:small subunit ribosomal protein S20
MAHSKQALKRHRQNVKANTKNRAQRSAMKSAIKKVAKAETPAAAKDDLVAAMKKIDKAAKQRVIHKNAAARLKSRMAKKLAKRSS